MSTAGLRDELASLRENLAAVTKLKCVYTSDEALNIILRYDAQITFSANQYGVSKEVVQAILYRELICLGIEDTIADNAVINYYTNGFGRPDSSTGLGQIFASTAIRAERGVNRNYTLDPDNPNDIWTMWKNLQDPYYNIDQIALVLGFEANSLGIKLSNATNDEVMKVLAKYNGTGSEALEYGRQTFTYYNTFNHYAGRFLNENGATSSPHSGSSGAEQGDWDPMNRIAFSDKGNGW